MTARSVLAALSLTLGLLSINANAAPCELGRAPILGPEVSVGSTSIANELFGGALPYPFENLLNNLRKRVGGESIVTALVPVGRSLLREAASPDYFESPRIVAAVVGDAPDVDSPYLANRLFFGFQPISDSVEIISHNTQTGRFEFEEVVDYSSSSTRGIEAAARETCAACHQNQAPIFARPLWSETNANPEVSARLEQLGSAFHGAPVRQNVDAVNAFDLATDRAGRLALANALWVDGCPDPACRGQLLLAAISYAATGRTPSLPFGAAPRFGANCPEGIAMVRADIPNRNPFLPETSGTDLGGSLNPETLRAAELVWQPDVDGFTGAAKEVAAFFAPSDIDWLDEKASGQGMQQRVVAVCTLTDHSEVRFDCTSTQLSASGFFTEQGDGRIETLFVDGREAAKRVAVSVSDGVMTPVMTLRLPDLRRVEYLSVSDGTLAIILVSDLEPLRAALTDGDHPALGKKPFDRRAILSMLGEVLDASNG